MIDRTDYAYSPDEVGRFYDETTPAFVATHGDVIQSLRTHEVSEYLDYTMDSARISNGMAVLDAGCGVGGPSLHFARKTDSIFHGITISKVQARMATQKAEEAALGERVNFLHGDYHLMDSIYGHDRFDRVLFLESFGHAHDKDRLLLAAWNVLRPDGILFIKDLFERESDDPFERQRIREAIHTINTGYRFNVGDLHDVLSRIRRLGFVIEHMGVPKVKGEQLDAFEVSTRFQDLTGIGLDPSDEEWVFPVDYLELRCRKPGFDPSTDREIYCLNR